MSEQMDGMEDQFPIPEGMTPEQGENYRQLMKMSHQNGFQELASEVLAQNPELLEKYLERHRRATINKVAATLSECRKLTDLPVETVTTLLDLPSQDAMGLVQAANTLGEARITLTPAEVKEAVDLARVIHVMEDEQIELMKAQIGQLQKGQDIGPANPFADEGRDYRTVGAPVGDRIRMAQIARARLKPGSP